MVVTKEQITMLQAGKLIEGIAKGSGGSEGGREYMAQSGAKEKQKLEEVLERAYSIVEEMIP